MSHSRLSLKYQVVETRSGTMILSRNVLNSNSSEFGLYVELSEKLFGKYAQEPPVCSLHPKYLKWGFNFGRGPADFTV